jgi:transcription initiation factor TFIIB
VGSGTGCELERIATEVGLPRDVRERAIPICCAMVERKLARGREIGIVAGSSIYAACRECLVPVTLKELASATRTTPRELGRIYMLILDRMEIKPPNPNGVSYIDKVATRIHASEEVAKLSQEIEREAIDAGLGGRNPMSLAAAALYTASLAKGEPVTQSDLAEAAGVSVISLRETAKCMRFLLRARKEGLSDSLWFAACFASTIGVAVAVLSAAPIFAWL